MTIRSEAAELGLKDLKRSQLYGGWPSWQTYDGHILLTMHHVVHGQTNVHAVLGHSHVRGIGETVREAFEQAAWLTEGGISRDRIRLHARLVEISQRGTQGDLP